MVSKKFALRYTRWYHCTYFFQLDKESILLVVYLVKFEASIISLVSQTDKTDDKHTPSTPNCVRN